MQEFRAAFESSPHGLLIVDAAGRIRLANNEIERLFGYTRHELRLQPVEVLVPDRSRSVHPGVRSGFFKNPIPRRLGIGRELFGKRKDGIEVPIEIGLTPFETKKGAYVICSIVDISARKRVEDEQQKLQEQLRQKEKMDALGLLAGGIAQQVNDILQSINRDAEKLLRHDAAEGLDVYLKDIIKNIELGKHIVGRILTLRRDNELRLQPVVINKLAESALYFLKTILPSGLDLKLQIEPGLPRVMGDATSIKLILIKLTKNAAHAMQKTGGVVDISLESFYAQDDFVRMHPGLGAGRYIRLMVRDTGSGMNDEIREHAFDPYFTTWPDRHAYGLGLSMVQCLVRDHGGIVWVDTEIGAGTAISCLFRTVDDDEAFYLGDEVSVPYGNSQKIMCVDDESTVLSINKLMLAELGYKPAVFVDPREALDEFRISPDNFDLAMIDNYMPYLDGIKLVREIQKIRQGFPTLLVSGLIKGGIENQYKRAGVDALLRKPFTRMELARELHSIFSSH